MGSGGKGIGGGGFGTKKRFIQALTSGEAGNRPLNRRVAAALADRSVRRVRGDMQEMSRGIREVIGLLGGAMEGTGPRQTAGAAVRVADAASRLGRLMDSRAFETYSRINDFRAGQVTQMHGAMQRAGARLTRAAGSQNGRAHLGAAGEIRSLRTFTRNILRDTVLEGVVVRRVLQRGPTRLR